MPLTYGTPVHDDEHRSLLEEGEERAKAVFSGFIDFAFSGNILEIAFGLMSVIILQPTNPQHAGPLLNIPVHATIELHLS